MAKVCFLVRKLHSALTNCKPEWNCSNRADLLLIMFAFGSLFCSDASVFTQKSSTTIGKIYQKVLYREYTDNTFTEEKNHPQHLGILGPVIKGEVGDVIKVYFKNKANIG